MAGPDRPDPGIPGVTWLGPCGRAELYERAYPEADVFVYPTTFDCAPLVVMEALAHGLPVVAPRSFGLPSLVGEGEGGMLFEPGDIGTATEQVRRLLTDDGFRARLSAGARDRYATRLATSVRNDILATTYRRIASSEPLTPPCRRIRPVQDRFHPPVEEYLETTSPWRKRALPSSRPGSPSGWAKRRRRFPRCWTASRRRA